MAVTQLCFASEGGCRRIPGDPVKPVHVHLRAEKCRIRTEHNLIRFRQNAADIKRLRCGNAQTLSLTDGVMDDAAMLSQNMAIQINEIPRL